MRSILPCVIDALSGFLEVRLTRLVDVEKLLWISIDEREPGALYLHHDPVTNLKGVVHVRHCELNLRYLVGNHCLGFFEAVAKARPHWLTAHEHFITAELHACWVWIRIRCVVGKNINDFDDKV